MIEKLRSSPIIISGNRHSKGSLFAHITEANITDAIFKQIGVSINPKQVHLKEAIKHHGTYQVILEEAGKKEEATVIVKE
jgi:ribosomal protein L9